MAALRGIIKLSHYQAEGRHCEFAVLCLKYVICIVAAAAIFVLWLRNYGQTSDIVFIFGVIVAAILAIYLRTSLHYRMYSISARYLRRECDFSLIEPSSVQLFGCGIMLLSLKCVVIALMLSPAASCFYVAMHYFSLSGERELCMLMLGATLCMLVSGIIFAAIILAHFDCAEYLFFSGECNSIFAALDTSWQVMEGNCDGAILLGLSLTAQGIPTAALSRLNMSAKLTREYHDKNRSVELCCELRQDKYGRESLDLIILRQ
jgi:hypothetical protein